MAYTVTSVQEDQIPDLAGNEIDVYDITFTVPNTTGNFTVQVPQAGDAVAAASAAIDAKVSEVTGILGLGA